MQQQEQQEQHQQHVEVPEFININNNYQEQQELQFNGVLCPLTPVAMEHEQQQYVNLSDVNNFDAPNLIQQQQQQQIEPRVTRSKLTGAIRKRTNATQQQPPAKKKKGKQAIPIQYIENPSKRLNTFNKRIKGVGKKLAELSILTGTEIDFSARSSDTGEIFRHCNVLDCATFRNHITFQEHHRPTHFTQITEDKYSEGLANLHKLHAGLRDKRAAGRKKKLTIEQQEKEMEKELEKLDENGRGIRLMLEKLKTLKYPTTTMLNRNKRYDDANRLTAAQNRRIQQQQFSNVIPLTLGDQETEEATGSVPQPQQQQLPQFYAFSSINRSENQVQQMHHQIADSGDTNTFVGVTDTVTKDGDNIYVHRNIQSSLQLKLSNLNKVTEALQSKNTRTDTQPQQVTRPISPFPFQSQQQHFDVNNNSVYPPFSPMPYSSPFINFPMTPQTQQQIMSTNQQQFARRPSMDIAFTPNLSESGFAEWLQTPHAVTSFDAMFGSLPN